jgi:transposase
MRRHELTEAEWARLAPLLPRQQPASGRPAADHRRILDGILWKLRSGAPWRDLPERYGSWSTVHSRFRRWRLAGVWDRLFAVVQQQADAAGQLDGDVHFVESSIVRAHQQAAGAQGGTRRGKRSGTARVASAPRSTSEPKAAAHCWWCC